MSFYRGNIIVKSLLTWPPDKMPVSLQIHLSNFRLESFTKSSWRFIALRESSVFTVMKELKNVFYITRISSVFVFALAGNVFIRIEYYRTGMAWSLSADQNSPICVMSLCLLGQSLTRKDCHSVSGARICTTHLWPFSPLMYLDLILIGFGNFYLTWVWVT